MQPLMRTLHRTCLGLLDKLVRKSPNHHLSFRLKVRVAQFARRALHDDHQLYQARLLQHEVLLNQPSTLGTATAALCKLRMQLLQDAYEAATHAVRLNNTSQLSISLLFAVVLQLLVETLVVRDYTKLGYNIYVQQ